MQVWVTLGSMDSFPLTLAITIATSQTNGFGTHFSDCDSCLNNSGAYTIGLVQTLHFSKFVPVFLHQNGLKKFRMPNFGCSNFFQSFCTKKKKKKKKIGTPNFGHSKFLPVFLHQNGLKNLEHPILAVPNFFQSFCTKMV